MAFQTGSQVNPSLGRVDYSPFMQGAIAGSQAMGQGIANFGQSIGAGIEKWQENKKAYKKEEGAIKSAMQFLENTAKQVKDPSLQQNLIDTQKRLMTGTHEERMAIASQLPTFVETAFKLTEKAQQDAAQQRESMIQGEVAKAAINQQYTPPSYLLPADAARVQMQASQYQNQQAKNLADIAKTQAETQALQQKPSKTPSEWETAYSAFISKNPSATPDDVQNFVTQYRQSARPTTNIDLGGNEFSKAAGKYGAEKMASSYDAAQGLQEQWQRAQQAKEIVASGDVSTGLGYEVSTFANRVKALLGDEKAASKVTNNEYLDTILGTDVFKQINALGIGARGLDTPPEREFIRKNIAGSRELSALTLMKMQQVRQNMLARAAIEYNSRIDSGELDKFFEQSGLAKKKIPVPDIVDISKYTPTVNVRNTLR